MDQEQELEQKVTGYSMLARENPGVDLAALTVNALQSPEQELLPTSTKRWAYVLSVVVPPAGVLLAVWLLMSRKSDSRKAALICLGLTILSIAFFVTMIKLFFNSNSKPLDQIDQVPSIQFYETDRPQIKPTQ